MTKIPKKIYFTWISEKPIPEKFEKYIASWKRVMPDYEIHQITLENVKRGKFVNQAIEIKNYALAGHYARVQELYDNGGIYFDIDIEAVNTLDPLLNHSMILGAESKWWVNNAVILAEKKHPYLKECMDFMDSVPFDMKKIELETGPIMFTNIMKKWGWSPGKAGTFAGTNKYLNNKRVTILTPEHFYPYHYDQFYTPECITPKTFTVHHWANSWNNKVSIVIPCYKQAEYLPDAIKSALSQTYNDFEIIVVNDGSPDNTKAVVTHFQKMKTARNIPIKYVEQENKGLSAARNAGIRQAAGGWILTLDADDKIHHEFLAKTVGVNDIVSTRLETFGTENKSWKSPLTHPTYKDLVAENHINCASLFKKDCWTIAGGYDETMRLGFEDWEFWIRCTKAGFNITSLDETLFYYRKRGDSMFTEAQKKRSQIIDYMKTKHPMVRAKGWK